MTVTIPGISLSILRQETSTQAGRPVLISGRFTAIGLGLPALIRVYLDGPSYNPEKTHFDTFASPFTGDYTIQVIANKDGDYKVYAQAFPFPMPSGPVLPESLLLLPPVAESEQPPLIVGAPALGGVSAQLPGGAQFMPAPPQTPIEIQVAVGAPSVSITMPGAGAAAPGFLGLPYLPPAPTPTPSVTEVPKAKAAVIDDLRMLPDSITPGQAGSGFMSWRNIGAEITYFNISFYLVSAAGMRYGPLQSQANVRAYPGAVITTPIQLNTVGLPLNTYDVTAEIYDTQTGSLVQTRTFSQKLKIVSGAAPAAPAPAAAAVPTLQIPTFPATPTTDMLGIPISDLPTQKTIGE